MLLSKMWLNPYSNADVWLFECLAVVPEILTKESILICIIFEFQVNHKEEN